MRKLGVKPTIEEQIKEFKKNEAAKRRSVRFDGNLGALSMIKPVRGLMAGKIHFAPEQGDNKLKEINDIFKNCLSAVTTNRVGTQNAFELQMIEHLEDLINLNDDEVEDEINEEFLESGDFNLHFSRASKALEGASRIYGFRVEAIYDRAFNFISHMSGKGGEGEGLGIEEEDEDDEAVRIAKEERERRETEEREKKEREMKERERLEKEEEERLKVMERIKTEEEGGDGDDDILKGEEGEGEGEREGERGDELKKETENKKKKEELNIDDGLEEYEREYMELEQLTILNKTIKPEDGSYFKRKKKRFYLGESGASLAKRSELDLDDLALTNIAVDTFFLKVNNIFDHSSAEFYLLPNLELDDDFSLQFDGDVEICEHRKRQVEAKLEKELSQVKLGKDAAGSNEYSDFEVNVFLNKKSLTGEGEREGEIHEERDEKENTKTEGMGKGGEGSTKELIYMNSFKKRREELLKPGSTSFLDDVDVTEEDTEHEKEKEKEEKEEKEKEKVAEKEKRLLYLKNQKFTSNYKKKVYVNFQKLANDFFKEDLEEAFEEAVSDIRFQAEELKDKMKEEFHGKSLTGFDWTDMAQSMLDMIMEGQVRAEEEDENEEEHEGSQKLKKEACLSLCSSEEKAEERKIKVKEEDVSNEVHSDVDDLKNDVREVEVAGIVKTEEQDVEVNKISVTNYSEGSTRSDDSEETKYFQNHVEFDMKGVAENFEKDVEDTSETPIEVEQCEKSSELSWLLELDGVSEAEPTVRVNIKEDDTGVVELEVKTEFGMEGILDRCETEKQLYGEMDEQFVEQLQLTNEGDFEEEICRNSSKLWNKLSAGEGDEKESTAETHAYTEERGNELGKEIEKDKEQETEKEKEKSRYHSRSDTDSQCLSDDSLWNVNRSLRNKLEKRMGEEKLLKTLMSVHIVDSDSSYNSLSQKWIQNNASWKQEYEQEDDEDEDEDEESEEYEEDEYVKTGVGKQNKRKGSIEAGG